MREYHRSFVAARCLADIRLLDQMGWNLSIATWKLIRRVGIGTVAAAAAVAAHGLVLWASESRSAAPALVSADVIVLVLVVVEFYLGAGVVVRLLLGTTSETIAHDPHESFLRALEIHRLGCVAAAALPWLTTVVVIQSGLIVGAVSGLLTVGSPPSSAIAWAPAVVLLTASAGAASALRSAKSRKQRGIKGAVAATALASLGLGGVGAFMAEFTRSTNAPFTVMTSQPAVVATSPVAAVGGGFAVAVLTAYVLHQSRSLARGSWSLSLRRDLSRAGERDSGWDNRGVVAPSPPRALANGLVHGAPSRPLLKLLRPATLISAAVIGFGVDSPLIRDLNTHLAGRAAVTVAFVVGLMLSDILLKYVGPVSSGRQLRFAREQGASVWTLAVSLVALHVTTALVIFAGPTIALVTLGVDVAPFIATVGGCIGGGLIAAAVSATGRVNDKEEASGSPGAIVVGVFLAALVVASALVLPAPAQSLTPVLLAFGLGGGAVLCVRKRILRRTLSVETW